MKSHQVLKSYYEKKRKDGRHFSMRSMAKRLDMSVSQLSFIFQGKRNLQIRHLNPICKILDVDQVDRDKILKDLLVRKSAEFEISKKLLKDNDGLDEDPYWEPIAKSDSVSDWKDLAIFLGCSLRDYDGTPEYIARTFLFDLSEVFRKMKQLAASGFLRMENEKFYRSKNTLQIKSGTERSFIRKLHADHLRNAYDELERNQSEESFNSRLITGLSFTIAEEEVPAFKQHINSFIESMARKGLKQKPDQVYHLGIQFFPLTKKRG